MYKVIENLGKDEMLNNWDETYVKSLNIALKFYTNCLYITDLSNALKAGKTCITYSLADIDYNNDSFHCTFFNWLTAQGLEFEQFAKNLLAGSYNTDNTGLKITIREQKGVNTFSPFVEVKAIKQPEKWTLPHVWKAILSGQIKQGICDGVYTDDYAFDAACNFQEGSISVIGLAKKLIESPSGWWVSARGEENGVIKLSVNCHHFDNNTLFFETENKKEVITDPVEVNTENATDGGVIKEATKRQLFALHCITKIDTRNWQLTRANASKLISMANAGADRDQIIDEATALGV